MDIILNKDYSLTWEFFTSVLSLKIHNSFSYMPNVKCCFKPFFNKYAAVGSRLIYQGDLKQKLKEFLEYPRVLNKHYASTFICN